MNYKDVLIGYIMFYDLIQDRIEDTFYEKIEKASNVVNNFLHLFPNSSDFEDNADFERTLKEYIKINL